MNIENRTYTRTFQARLFARKPFPLGGIGTVKPRLRDELENATRLVALVVPDMDLASIEISYAALPLAEEVTRTGFPGVGLP